MFYSKNLILFSLVAMNFVDQPAPEVDIEQGTLTGKLSADGAIFEYVGIPYASVGERFQAPLPPPSWEGTFKAIDEHYQCPQYVVCTVLGMEDCLKINVYVPVRKKGTKDPLAVMVYIHGGGFVLGNGGKMMYGPNFLVRYDVILVTFNYRLGTLGFLCLGIKEAPGNAGIKDQIAALRWVKNNIAAFGGDPDKVTIFGHSAGAATASLLIASGDTDGLFNRAIIQSGSALAFWASTRSGLIAKSVAKYLGYENENLNKLYNFFANLPLKKMLLPALGEPIIDTINSNILHLPCVEKNFSDVESVISDLPFNMIMKKPKNISIIYGVTNQEGLYLVSEETNESFEKINQNVYPFSDMEFSSEQEARRIKKKVKNFYFGDKIINQETQHNLSNLYGDVYLFVPTVMESEIMNRKIDAPIYNYYFKYSGGRNMVKAYFCRNKHEPGASHGDDILYLFNSYIWPYRINNADQKMIDSLTKMWTNFAKYGDPTPPSANDLPVKWNPSTKDTMNFLIIDEELKMGPLPNPERYNFWKELYEKYRKLKP